MATVYKSDGTHHEINPANGRDFSLDELRSAIGGGYIEIVHPRKTPGILMIVDEDGFHKGLPPNAVGTATYGGPIVGDVLICEPRQVR